MIANQIGGARQSEEGNVSEQGDVIMEGGDGPEIEELGIREIGEVVEKSKEKCGRVRPIAQVL